MGTDVKRILTSSFIGAHRCSSVASALLALTALVLAMAAPVRAENRKAPEDYLLHLPGISGYHWLDKQFLAGLRGGGFAGDIDVRDWPGDEPGLAALFARRRNDAEAKVVADMIVERARTHPRVRIVLTGHSGGAGIAVWALEKLPADVKVDTVLLLAPALSPEYDLTKALGHVRGKVYAYTSTLDAVVLGAGTTTFGTIDGVKCSAAGRYGFVVPEDADVVPVVKEAYTKLVQMPYDAKWMREGNVGDHIGPMGFRFARNVVAQVVLTGEAPQAGNETLPAKRQAPSTAARRDEGLASSRKKESSPQRAPVKSGATAP